MNIWKAKEKNIYIVIFVITTIVASCIAVYFWMISNNNQNALTSEVEKLKNENNDLSKQIQSLSEKSDDKKEAETTTEKTDVEKNNITISSDEVIKITEDILNLRSLCFASPDGVWHSKYLNYYSDYEEMIKHLTIKDNGNLTEIKYEDFKNKMLSYMTEELFLNDSTFKKYQNNNGLLFIPFGGASGGEFKIADVKLISNNNGVLQYSYNGIFSFTREEKVSGKVTIVKVNDKYVVSSYEVPTEF